MQFSLKIHFHAPLRIPQTHQYLTRYLYRHERLRGIATAKITSLTSTQNRSNCSNSSL